MLLLFLRIKQNNKGEIKHNICVCEIDYCMLLGFKFDVFSLQSSIIDTNGTVLIKIDKWMEKFFLKKKKYTSPAFSTPYLNLICLN